VARPRSGYRPISADTREQQRLVSYIAIRGTRISTDLFALGAVLSGRGRPRVARGAAAASSTFGPRASFPSSDGNRLVICHVADGCGCCGGAGDGDGEQLLPGDGAVCRRRPHVSHLRPQATRRARDATLHQTDRLGRGLPAQGRHHTPVCGISLSLSLSLCTKVFY